MENGMIIGGSAIIGWLAVEFLAVFAGGVNRLVRIPIGMNVLGALAGGLIAGGICS